MLELKISPLPQERVKEAVQSWLYYLPKPCVFEFTAEENGVRLRLFLEKGKGEGVASSWASLMQQQSRWALLGTGKPLQNSGKFLRSAHELPAVLGDSNILLSLAGYLLEARKQSRDPVTLQIWITEENKRLQEDLRALASYSYGTKGGVDDDAPNPWSIRLKLTQIGVGLGVFIAGIFGGILATKLIPIPLAFLGVLSGTIVMLASTLSMIRWMRYRSVPKDVLTRRAEEPVFSTSFVYVGQGEGPALLTGQNWWQEIEGDHYPKVKSLTIPLPASEIAMLLSPTSTGEGASIWVADSRQDVPYPPPSVPLQEARFQVGVSPANGKPIGIDPDGHALIIGGSRTGKSSMAYQVLKNLLEKGDDAPGVFLVDPHLSLADAFIDAIAQLEGEQRKKAIQRLRVITPDQPELLPLNILTIPNFTWAANAFVQVGKRIWEDYWGPRMQAALLGLFRVSHAWNMNHPGIVGKLGLIHTVFLAYSINWRHETIMQYLPPDERMSALALDALLGQMSGESMNSSQQGWVTEVISPILSKVMALELSPWLYASMHQDSFIDLESWIKEKAFIVLRLPAGSMGREGARLTASMVYNVFDATYRSVTERVGQIPYWIIVDEVPEIAVGMRLESMLSEGGKFGARVFALSQSLSMMRKSSELEPVVQSLLANTSTQAFFSPDPDDAVIIRNALSAEERFGEVTTDMPSLHAWLRARIKGVWQPPTVIRVNPLAKADPQRVQEVIREVIAIHPKDYMSPDGWQDRALASFVNIVPPSMKKLVDIALGKSGASSETRETPQVPLMTKIRDEDWERLGL